MENGPRLHENSLLKESLETGNEFLDFVLIKGEEYLSGETRNDDFTLFTGHEGL
jgi:hypothetical protein